MVNYVWSFPQFDVAPSEDGLTDVVKVIYWRLDANDGPYNATAYGSVALDEPNPKDFTPYSEITEQWAIDCVSAQLNMEELKANMIGEINAKKAPKTVPMEPPFAAA